jgi:hypothetical protein
MDQRRRLERLAGRGAVQLPCRQPAQLGIDQRQQIACGHRTIAAAGQDIQNLRHGR